MTKQIEAMKLALEALDNLIKKTSGQSIYSFMETERRIAMAACVGLREALAEQPLEMVEQPADEPSGPLVKGWSITFGEGHAGYGVYAHMEEYPEEGAFLLLSVEQPAQQEPVANIRTWRKNGELHAELWNWDRGIESLPDGEHDLYTSPPQRNPLTDEQIADIVIEMNGNEPTGLFWRDLARAIEAAHGIKE